MSLQIVVGVISVGVVLVFALYLIGREPLGASVFSVTPPTGNDERLEWFRSLDLRAVSRERERARERSLEPSQYQGDLPWLQSRQWSRLEQQMKKTDAQAVGDLGERTTRRWASRLGITATDRSPQADSG